MTESNSESVRVLEKGIEQAHAALLAVREDQLMLPTPCEQWDVGQLVAHLAHDPANMLDMATGGAPDWSATPDRVEDPAGTFRAGADAMLAHWRESEESADWQIAELAVHTWDVATATGQPTESLDPEVAERGLAFMSEALKPELRGHAFGPERTAPEGASAHERIAAFSGRVVR